jgi:hypothetical protein
MPEKNKREIVWDKGIDYEEFEEYLEQKINELWPPEGKREEIQLMYYSILATQLFNGARISETLEAFKKWVETGEREQEVRVRKKKSKKLKKHEKFRIIKIPEILPDKMRIFFKDHLNVPDDVLLNRIKKWASLKGYNTHSLRYAWITQRLKEGYNPAIVAKMVRHARTDQLMTYTQTLYADNIIRSQKWGQSRKKSQKV